MDFPIDVEEYNRDQVTYMRFDQENYNSEKIYNLALHDGVDCDFNLAWEDPITTSMRFTDISLIKDEID